LKRDGKDTADIYIHQVMEGLF